MEAVFSQLLALLYALWWPFCRALALLSAAPVVGDGLVPMPLRVLLALALAVVMLPMAQGGEPIDAMSMRGVAATVEQAVIGGVIGLALHFAISAVMVFGYLASSQLGFAMAVMNDPVNGTPSDVVSACLVVLCTLVFFAVDGHLVVVGVLGASFRAWPVGGTPALDANVLRTLADGVAWVFAAALLLAVPLVFSTLVVQVGFGLLNRVAPSLNLHSLGFSLLAVFGLLMLAQMMRAVPEQYVQMTGRVLELLQAQMQASAVPGR
jgi:flagellar biosynthetic protein FliR